MGVRLPFRTNRFCPLESARHHRECAMTHSKSNHPAFSGRLFDFGAGAGHYACFPLADKLFPSPIDHRWASLGPLSLLSVVTGKGAYSDDTQLSAAIVLICRSAGRPFAYFTEGDYSHHPPL